MANWASTAYAIEGPKETLEKIREAIVKAIETKDNRYEEYKTCDNLGITYEETKVRLGGLIEEEPDYDDKGALRFFAEERWGLQEFNELLEQRFPGIKVYWIVEESGCEVYATNDKEGKYFPERYWVDTCIDGNYQSEYFQFESSVYKWLHGITGGRVRSAEDAEKFNSDYEDSEGADDNFIYIHEFTVID